MLLMSRPMTVPSHGWAAQVPTQPITVVMLNTSILQHPAASFDPASEATVNVLHREASLVCLPRSMWKYCTAHSTSCAFCHGVMITGRVQFGRSTRQHATARQGSAHKTIPADKFRPWLVSTQAVSVAKLCHVMLHRRVTEDSHTS